MPMKQGESKTAEAEKIVNTVRHESEPLEDAIQTLEGPASLSYAKELAFMHEPVEVLILESQNTNDTTQLVTISVNGKSHFLLRGQWKTVPRFVLEILAKSKKEAWNFSFRKNSDGSTSDVDRMSRILRYPHQWRDKNPKGATWYDSIKDSFL